MFVDDITAFTNWRTKELVEMAEKVLEKCKREVEERGLKLSITGREKERKKEEGNHFLQVSGGKVSGMQQERRSCFGDEC